MSSKLSVAIHILAVLALEPETPWTSERLAQSVTTNPVVIRRLLGLLRDAGFVESRTGVGGGWSLRAEPGRINLLEVLRAVEPSDQLFALHKSTPNPKCHVGRNICPVLTEIYAGVEAAMTDRLAATSLAEVVAKLPRPAPTLP